MSVHNTTLLAKLKKMEGGGGGGGVDLSVDTMHLKGPSTLFKYESSGLTFSLFSV